MGGFIIRFGSGSEPKLEQRASEDEFAEKEKVSVATKPGDLEEGTDQTSPQPQKPPSKSSSIITSATEAHNAKDSRNTAVSIPKNPPEDTQPKAPSKSDCPLRGRTGHSCPCRSVKSDAAYTYMSFNEITAHPSTFWNGRFRVFPFLLSFGHKYSTDPEKSLDGKKNQDIAGQCLYKLAIECTTTQTDFDIVAERLAYVQGSEWTLDAEQMRIARERGILDSLPSFSVEELDDQSKGDILVKSLAVVTVFYLVLELIFRYVAELPSSQLEVAVIAFSATASVIYFLFFLKPQDVGVSRYIDAARYPSPEDMRLIALAAPVRFSVGGGGKRLFIEVRNMALHNCGSSVALDDSGQALSLKIFLIGAALGGSLFAAIHCVAWNFSFPTPVELLLWRTTCLATIVLPIIAPLQNLSVKFVKVFMRRYFARKDMVDTGWRFHGFIGDHDFIVQVLLQAVGVVYILSRMYLIVEVFRALFFLPPEAFVATSWPIEFPHFG
jgi:hypothetical protein